MRNTLGKEQAPQNLVRPISDEDLQEYCDKNYHQILPIIAEKLHQEKAQQEKLKAVKACLNFEEASSGSPETRHGRSKSPREKDPERRTVFKRLEKVVFHRLGDKEKNVSAHSRGSERKSYYSSRRDTESCYQNSRSKETEIASEKHRHKREYSRRTEAVSESEGSAGGYWKSKPKKQKSNVEDDLSQPWVYEETDPFTPRIQANKRNVKGRKTFTFDQGIKAKPWKIPGKDSKKGGNLRERQIAGNINGEEDGTEGPMVIEAEMGGHCPHRIYVDEGTSSEILYEHCFSKFRPEIKNQLIPANTPLVGFSGEIIWPLGKARGKEDLSNPIHGARNDKNPSGWRNSHIVEQQDHPARMLNGFRTRSTAASDMAGVPRHIAEHRLNVREGCLPVIQKKKGQAPERNKAISEKVKKVSRGRHHERCPLPQLAIKPKHDDSWRMVQGGCERTESMPGQSKGSPRSTVPKVSKGYTKIEWKTAAEEAINAVLMIERDGKQVPIYFVIRALQGPEINYTLMEKLILALVSSSKLLNRYFQAHITVVIMDQPIKQLMSNPEVTGRLLKWRFEQGERDIQYRPRTSVKGQILADFIVERPEDDTPDTSMKDKEELPDPWILLTDRSSCIDGSGAGLINTNSKGMEFTYALRFRFNATNNEAEYEALIAGLRIARQMGVQNLQANVDSKLVANQGINIAGPFPEGPGKVKFLIVAMDYFIKWIKARPVATITGSQVKKFVWDNIVCKFGLPREIVSDNEKQFKDNPFKDWCEKLTWISWRRKESKLQYRKQGAKPKWKDITTPGSETQASVQETLSTETTKQAMRKTGESSGLSGRDHTKSRKHWAKERTSLETVMDTPFREHGISVTLKSVICMKCKHHLHVKQSGKEDTDRILFICKHSSYLHKF
nr:reverse transcriptase domain-containing protein [Tanacetum cinerariifolium]